MKRLRLRIEREDLRKARNFAAQQERDAASGTIRHYGKIVDVDEGTVAESEYELFRTLDAEQCESWIRNLKLSIKRANAQIKGIQRALKELRSGKRNVLRSSRTSKR